MDISDLLAAFRTDLMTKELFCLLSITTMGLSLTHISLKVANQALRPDKLVPEKTEGLKLQITLN